MQAASGHSLRDSITIFDVFESVCLTILSMRYSLNGARAIKKMVKIPMAAKKTFWRNDQPLRVEIVIPFPSNDNGVFKATSTNSWPIKAGFNRNDHSLF